MSSRLDEAIRLLRLCYYPLAHGQGDTAWLHGQHGLSEQVRGFLSECGVNVGTALEDVK